MVMALHRAGWRVVLDVVYNHTFRAGPHDRSVERGDISHPPCGDQNVMSIIQTKSMSFLTPYGILLSGTVCWTR